MEETTTATGMIPVEDIKTIISSTPQALQMNMQSVEKAEAAGTALLEQSIKEGMSDELDAKMNNYLAIVDKTIEAMEGRRKPTTSLFDSIRKRFTELETKLSRKTPQSISSRIQQARDRYAIMKREEQAAREKELLRQQNVEKDKIEFKKNVSGELNSWFLDSIQKVKSYYFTQFNAAENEDALALVMKDLEAFPAVMPEVKFSQWSPVTTAMFLSPEMKGDIITKVKGELIECFKTKFTDEVNELKRELADRVPGKKKELEEIRNASIERANQLKIEADARAKAEQDRIAKESDDARMKAESNADLVAQAEQAEATFSAEVSRAETSTVIPKGRDGVEITVLQPQGIVLIFQTWFNIIGKDLSVDKILATKVESMVKACEKHSFKTGEKIDSPKLIQYKDTFKTKISK